MDVELSGALLLIVTGFIPHLVVPRLRFKLPASGTLTLSASIATYGLLALLVAAILERHSPLTAGIDRSIIVWLSEYFPAQGEKPVKIPAGAFVTSGALSLICSLVIAFSQYWVAWSRYGASFPESWRQRQRLAALSTAIAADQSAPLNRLLTLALLQQTPVQISLKSGKVYIGVLIRLSTPADLEKGIGSLGLIPIMSGYRTSEAHRLEITTNYQERLESLRKAALTDAGAYAALTRIGIYFSNEQIESATQFDPLVRRHFS